VIIIHKWQKKVLAYNLFSVHQKWSTTNSLLPCSQHGVADALMNMAILMPMLSIKVSAHRRLSGHVSVQKTGNKNVYYIVPNTHSTTKHLAQPCQQGHTSMTETIKQATQGQRLHYIFVGGHRHTSLVANPASSTVLLG
jgi:hypothetical protein